MNESVEHFLALVQTLDWPTAPTTTPAQRLHFEAALDQAAAYTGDPQTLYAALQSFIATGSRPYAYAGTALVLHYAAYDSGDTYDRDGLAAARSWLQRAQALAPDQVEIAVIEAQLDLAAHDFPQARAVLDRLLPQSRYFYLYTAELAYWALQQDAAQVQTWYARTAALAESVPRRVQVLNQLAGFYFTHKLWRECITTYRTLTQLKPTDPWIWHNLSLAYYWTQQYPAAQECNVQALALMPFEEAAKLARVLQTVGTPPPPPKRSWQFWKTL